MPESTNMAKGKRVTVGLARGSSVGEAVTQAIALAGGLGFIKAGDIVLVKPNVNSADPYPGTTNPEVLYEVIRRIWERDPRRIIVGDRSWYRDTTLNCMKKAGLYEAAGEARAEVIPFEDGRWIKVHPEGAIHWQEGFSIPGLLEIVHHIISLPVVKTHRLATFTMALKNSVGCILPEERLGNLHTHNHAEPRFGSLIAEINLAVPVSFVIMDGTRAFVSGGPAVGEMVEPRLVIASKDRIANDVTGLALLKTLGTTPAIAEKSVWEQPQIRRAVELGLGVKSAQEIELKGQGVPELERIRQNLL